MERRKWLTWAVGQEVADKIYDKIDGFGTSDKQCHFIVGSFLWQETKEGYDYWSSVDSEIKKYFARNINPRLTSFLEKNGLWDKFIDNFNPEIECGPYGIGNSFIWAYAKEGYDFWSEVADNYHRYKSNNNLSLTKKSKNDENQLQGKEDPRGEGDESGRGGIRREGDESRFRLSYTQYRKSIDFQKREVRDFEVHISTRHTVLL